MTQIRSGVVTRGTPSSQPTANSFWKASSKTRPRKSPSPSSVARPRRKPSVARRATSASLPLKINRPCSASTTASIGSRWARRAACTVRPMRIALLVEPRIAHSFTSFPVRGALQVAAMEPTATQAVRERRSIHFHDAARATTTAFSRTSTSVSGYIGRSWMANEVICASGKARPMQSASTTGRSRRAAAMNGWMALPPPISSDMIAQKRRPRYSSIIVTARAIVCGSVRRSWPTSGAPMLDTTATRSSSARSSGSISDTIAPSR